MRTIRRILTGRYAQPLAGALLLAAACIAGDAAGAGADGRITVLYDAFSADPSLRRDWGFAALIEIGGKRILFDTGNDAATFAHNVARLGVDLTTLDFVVMSHRHGDHVGGLDHLLAVNPAVTIYAPQENFGVFGATFPGTFYRRDASLPEERRYFGGIPPDELHFGTPWPEGRFVHVDASREVAPGMHLLLLRGPWGVDLDVMELSLAIETAHGTVLIVGCSHPRIENIVAAAAAATGQPIALVLGGLHLLPADDDETRRIATALRDDWKIGWIAPDHCTGEPAFRILEQAFGERYLYAGLGATVELGAHPRSLPAAAAGVAAGRERSTHRD